MFDRFTVPARKVMSHARNEAERLQHTTIGTEHLLLGLLREKRGDVRRLLELMDVEADVVRGEVERRAREDPRWLYHGSPDTIPCTPAARDSMEHAAFGGRWPGRERVEPGHLLLGLVLEETGLAGDVLRGRGVTAEKLEPLLSQS